jgi:uncharacterized membrane protein YfcA
MSGPAVLLIALLILAAALLYSSVGHAGASGYLAVMALFAVAPAVMRPTALVLNILVSIIATTKFYRAGRFSWSLFWPFAVTSIPAAFIGGHITLATHTYKTLVGTVLLYAAVRMFLTARSQQDRAHAPPLVVPLICGAAIGLLSGLTGVGGGIFLTPLLLLMGWAETRQAAGVSAPFILVNSIAGLMGQIAIVANVPGIIALWALAAGMGGFVGAEYGSRRLATPIMRRLLSAVLVVAGVKMILV